MAPQARSHANGFYINPEPVLPGALVRRAAEEMDRGRAGEDDTGVPTQPSAWKPGDDPRKLGKIEMPQVADRAIESLDCLSTGDPMNRRSFLTCVTFAAVSWTALPAVHAQDADSRPQAEVASKGVKFATLPTTAREYKEAREATDLEGARKLVGKPATFKGTVVQVLAPDSNNMVTLSFARDPKSALTAVVHKENFFRFPKLEDLKGKTVTFTSRVVGSEGRPEVVLIRPGQLKIVE